MLVAAFLLLKVTFISAVVVLKSVLLLKGMELISRALPKTKIYSSCLGWSLFVAMMKKNLLSFIFYSVPLLVIHACLFAPYCGLCPFCSGSAKKDGRMERFWAKWFHVASLHLNENEMRGGQEGSPSPFWCEKYGMGFSECESCAWKPLPRVISNVFYYLGLKIVCIILLSGKPVCP